MIYSTENDKEPEKRRATGRCQQGNLPNHPTVLLSNDRGVERNGKRGDERNTSGVCTRAEQK
ncbi:MAG: hypothetical protein WC446_03285 [Candidatus Paceibacterota bacterium]